MRPPRQELVLLFRACFSTVALVAIALSLAHAQTVLPNTTRRLEAIFILMLGLLLLIWNLIDALVGLVSGRRRSRPDQ